EYHIVGDGPQLRELEKLSEKYSDAFAVHLHGHRESPYFWIKSSPIFVIPSLEEGFGLVAIEAIYHGKLVVYSDIPALREICGDMPFCYPFDPFSQSSFISALGKAFDAFESSDLESDLKRRLATILEKFSLVEFKRAYADFIKSMIIA